MTLFLMLQVIGMFLNSVNINRDIVIILNSVIICFIIDVNFNRKKRFKKVLLSSYITFIIFDLIFYSRKIDISLDHICNLVILTLILNTMIKVYYKKIYVRCNNMNAKLNRLNITIKVYNIKFDTLKKKNIKRQRKLNNSIEGFRKLLINLNSEIYFIDQTLTYVYKYKLDQKNLYEVQNFKSFFDKEVSSNLVILENLYDVLYDCQNHSFEIKNNQDEYYKYEIYPNTLLEGTLGLFFIKTKIKDKKLENYNNLKNISRQNSLINKMNLSKQKYELFVDIISEAVFVIDYSTKKLKYTNKSFDIILDKNKLSLTDIYDLIKNSSLNYCGLSLSMEFQEKKLKNSLNENVYLEFANMFLNINHKNIIIGVLRDVTEKVKGEMLRKKVQEEAYTKKLKNDFLINLSHELKTPINLIYLKNQLTRLICEKNNNIKIEEINFLNRELKNIKILMNLIESIICLEKLNLEFYEDKRNCYNIIKILEDIVIKLNKYKNVHIVFDTNINQIFTLIDPYNISKVIIRLLAIINKYSDYREMINLDISKKKHKINIHIYNTNKKLNLDNAFETEIKIVNTNVLLCRLILNLYGGDLQIKDRFSDINIQLDSINNLEYSDNNQNKLIEESFIDQEFQKIYNL